MVYRLTVENPLVLRAIAACRTAALGGHVELPDSLHLSLDTDSVGIQPEKMV